MKTNIFPLTNRLPASFLFQTPFLVAAILVGLAAHQPLQAQGKLIFDSDRDMATGAAINPEIYAMNPNGSLRTRLTTNSSWDYKASPSADGSKITFTSNRSAGNNDIYVMSAGGSGQKRLTTHSATDADSCFSPDATQIAFISTRDGNSEIYKMNADGSNQKRLTRREGLDQEPVWSPDGSKIAFTSYNSGGGIFLMNSDGTAQTDLTPTGVFDFEPAFRPDGTRIVFASQPAGTSTSSKIWVMNPDGTNRIQLTSGVGSDGSPCFSPDGSKITFCSTRSGNKEIYTMNADGSGVVRVTNNPWDEQYVTWAPGAVTLRTLTVDTLSDSADSADGLKSLHEAIILANDQIGPNTISFAPGLTGTITLTSVLPRITDDTMIQGRGARILALSGSGKFRLLLVSTSLSTLRPALTLRGLTLRDGLGDADVNNPTGAALQSSSALQVSECLFENNVVVGNSGSGAVLNQGQAVFANCTFSNNRHLEASGSAVLGGLGSALSTIKEFNAQSNPTVALTNCTFSGNGAGFGGAIYCGSNAPLTMNNCTLSGNTSRVAGAIFASDTLTLNNSIVAGNQAPENPDIYAPVAGSYNLIGVQGNGLTLTGTNNKVGTPTAPLNPRLGTLANNGGKVDTFSLASSSPARNAGSSALLPADTFDMDGDKNIGEPIPCDARGNGFARIKGSVVDIGAFEALDTAQSGASLVVNTLSDTTDDGICGVSHCSLREAINAANSQTGADTISFVSGLTGTITLGSTLPRLMESLEINGPSARSLAISGAGKYSILDGTVIGPLTLRRLTIRDGVVAVSTGATLQAFDCWFTNNTSENGGAALYPNGATTLINCTFSDNRSDKAGLGGAIRFTENTTPAAMTNCTFFGNSARIGGVIFQGRLTLNNCTFSGNSAPAGAGAILANGITLNNCIVAGNKISEPNATDPDISGGTVGGDYNFIGVKDVNLTLTGTHNQVGTPANPLNPRLSALANNGGNVDTLALLSDSPARNAGNNAFLPTDVSDMDGDGNVTEAIPFDARGTGFARIRNITVDIGAYEENNKALRPSGRTF